MQNYYLIFLNFTCQYGIENILKFMQRFKYEEKN